MSFWTKYIEAPFLGGVDVGAEQERQSQLDASITAANQQLVDKGIWTQQQFDDAQANLGRSDTADVQGAVGQAFAEGLGEGRDNVTGAVSGTFRQLFKFIWDALPWQVWACAVVAGFIYLGGIDFLRRKLAKA